MKGAVALVALKGAASAYDKLYTYVVPPDMQRSLTEGMRVTVPFGKGNTKKQGMVFHLKEAELRGLKSISSVIDEKPILEGEMLRLAEYMQKTVFCTYYDAVAKMLPIGLSHRLVDFYSANPEFCAFSVLSDTEREIYAFLSSKGETEGEKLAKSFGIKTETLSEMALREILIKTSDLKQRMNGATQKWVSLAEDLVEAKLTPRQKEITELLSEVGSAAVKEICYFTGVSVSVIENLIKKGILISFEKQIFRAPYKSVKPKKDEITLTEEQGTAFEGLMSDYRSVEAKVALLHGVTGSGKTQVFLRLVDEVLGDNKGVIVMVPEIALTPQMISIFTSRYGEKIAVFHSAMSMGQRMDEWQRIKEGKALIAIGTRSAVFAPFNDLGLIIIDEEQEHTYKSEQSPRFHTRELAKYRISSCKGLLCLASATPSVESYTKALSGKYSLYKLTHRYGNALLPEVETVDMKNELLNGNSGVLSHSLYEALKETLEEKKQAILLLNRRGHNTYISCADCGYVAECPNCSVSLTYHSANDRLMCHYCGYSEKAERVCPKCGGRHMKFLGLGTQKAEEELKAIFPNARVLRLDADSTASRNSYASLLGDFANGQYDILLGTQMVAKGLDFPNVTLVGVLGADSAMYSEDFRGFERTFSLLTQVIGRAGRGDNAGRAIIQTMNPESNLIELAEKQDYESFYSEEILSRRVMTYPPYCDICVVSARSGYKAYAEESLQEIFKNIKSLTKQDYKDVKLIILGPAPSAIPRVGGKYRHRMIIKCRNNERFREMLRRAIDIKLKGETALAVDINPETVI